jgi:release factor glutamine methyltransferase
VASLTSIREAVRLLATEFRDAGINTPELDARILACTACNISHADYILRSDTPISSVQQRQIDAMRQRRLAGEPVSRIVGKREFWGHEFIIDRHTLDPRPDTETIIEAVLAYVKAESKLEILDLGTGSGAILLSLLLELPNARGIGVDRSIKALMTASLNAHRLGCAKRSNFVCSDWLTAINMTCDIVVANPPYIPEKEIRALAREVREHDPVISLDGGPDGLYAYRQIMRSLPATGERVFFELGHNQLEALAAMLEQAGATDLKTTHDLAGIPRCISFTHRQ